MRAVFADTFYWVALTHVRDSGHEQATRFSRSLASALLVTTEAVLIEYLNFFAVGGPHLRRMAVASANSILASSNVRIVALTPDLFRAGLDLYAARLDKRYSLTDCISMVTMRRQGLTESLTNDEHFDQEGFRALFRAG